VGCKLPADAVSVIRHETAGALLAKRLTRAWRGGLPSSAAQRLRDHRDGPGNCNQAVRVRRRDRDSRWPMAPEHNLILELLQPAASAGHPARSVLRQVPIQPPGCVLRFAGRSRLHMPN
jgi:hypothetical protein